jgi:hypothetical protein
MNKTLAEAHKIESELLTHICNAMDLLNYIHTWGDHDLDRTKLWESRARVQDALRAMHDLHQLRKDLPYVNPDLGTN